MMNRELSCTWTTMMLIISNKFINFLASANVNPGAGWVLQVRPNVGKLANADQRRKFTDFAMTFHKKIEAYFFSSSEVIEISESSLDFANFLFST